MRSVWLPKASSKVTWQPHPLSDLFQQMDSHLTQSKGFDQFPKGDVGRIAFWEIVLLLRLISGDSLNQFFIYKMGLLLLCK